MLAMTMTDAEQSNQRTLEDYDLYQKEERDLVVKLAKASLEQSKQSLQYEQDELEQLEKMYEADDLTEETEEIVLKRQRSAVKLAETYMKVAEFSYDYQLRLSMPRQDADIKEGVDRQKLSYERTKASLQLDLNKGALRTGTRAGRPHQGARKARQITGRPGADDHQGAGRWHGLLRPLHAGPVE